MTDLSISPGEIRGALNSFMESYRPSGMATEEMGYVTETANGITHVEGLPRIMASELLCFADGMLDLVMNLDQREIGVVILGDFGGIEEGQRVHRTGEALSVPAGDGYPGRTVDPLGRPIDDPGDITDIVDRRAPELQAPGVMMCKSVHGPLATGLKAIDSIIPIKRGQRRLIIGNRKTGKTAVTPGVILNQHKNWKSGDPKKQVRCIYVAIGQKGSTIALVCSILRDAGAMEYTTIVAPPASGPAGYKYMAPYTGPTIGQHWVYEGKHVLIVFDDLSRQARTYHAVSLLLCRLPGRETYPGDVFYLRSRLLERCAKLSDELGGKSMTGLPIIETKASDVSAYAPTNVISITDRQIFLQSDLFSSNQRPAIDVGISVSRIGGDTQVEVMKRVTGTFKITPAQYRLMTVFAVFASDLDPATHSQLTCGRRLMELLKWAQLAPYMVREQVASTWTGTHGYLGDIGVSDVLTFERPLLDHLKANSKVLNTTELTGLLESDTEAELKAQVEAFHGQWASTGGGASLDDAEVEAEAARRKITRIRPSSQKARDMGGKQRTYKQRITSTQTLAKVFRAMEMITASRIGGARRAVTAPGSYEKVLTQAVVAVVVYTGLDHPLTCERFGTPRVAAPVIASDRSMAGTYSATILREPERLISKPKGEGKVSVVYAFSKRARSYLRFRGATVEKNWEDESDTPTRKATHSISNELFG